MTDNDDSKSAPPYPKSLLDFERQFPDERACIDYLYELRWPDGFVCPHCGHEGGCELKTGRRLTQCSRCRKKTSVTAGTMLHRAKLPVRTWFWAAWLMATHSNGISAMQLQKQLGLSRYETAWDLARKLREAMVDPERHPLAGIVEIDETSMPYRTKNDPPAGGQGRSMEGKIGCVGAVELDDAGHIGRVRLGEITDYSAKSLTRFVEAAVEIGALLRSDGLPSYAAIEGYRHEPTIIGTMAAHIAMPAIHTLFSNLKAWAKGVYHGLRKPRLQSYFDEYTFRFNRRKNRPSAFRSLLRTAMKSRPSPFDPIPEATSSG